MCSKIKVMLWQDFQHWAEDMMRILLEDIEESKKLTRETRALTIEARKQAEIAQKQAEAAQKQADSAWELATVARLELKEFRKPWWKKLFGMNGE